MGKLCDISADAQRIDMYFSFFVAVVQLKNLLFSIWRNERFAINNSHVSVLI